MANWANYFLHVIGGKSDIERLYSIFKDEDAEYSIYVADETDDLTLDDIGSGVYSADFYGQTKWSTDWLAEPSQAKEKDKGRKVVTFLDISDALELTMEWYSEECGCEFNEYCSVSNGTKIRSDSVFWANPPLCSRDKNENIKDFERCVSECTEKGIDIDMSEVEEVRKNDYEGLLKGEFSFGGYEWSENTLSDIRNGKEPIVKRDIYL